MKLTRQIIIGLICVFLLGATIISCKKNGQNDQNGQLTDAIVINYGDPAIDGCGWVVKIIATDSVYSPKNLPEMYQVGNLKVRISYTKLQTRFPCGDTPFGPRQIQLDTITKE